MNNISKREVPLAGRPAVYYITIVLSLLGYLLVLTLVPDAHSVRPGLVEALIGITLGSASGVLASRAWTAYLAGLTVETRRRPWLKWASLAVTPLPPFGLELKYRAALVVSFFASFTAIALLFVWLYQRYPNSSWLEWPWMRANADMESQVIASVTAAMLVYVLAVIVVTGTATVRWYRSLAD